jgi:hypothetical protein
MRNVRRVKTKMRFTKHWLHERVAGNGNKEPSREVQSDVLICSFTHAPAAAAHEAEHEPRVAREVRGVPAPAEVHPCVVRVVRIARKPGPRLVPRRLLACVSSDQKRGFSFTHNVQHVAANHQHSP